MCQKFIQTNSGGDVNQKNIKGKTALNVATEHEQFHVFEYLISQGAVIRIPNKDKMTSLYFVCKNGHMSLVKKYVEDYGADVNSKRCLSVAAEQDHFQVLEYLMSCTSSWSDVNEPNKDGLTPLYSICRNGHLDLTKKCVENYGANVNSDGCLAVALEFYHHDIGQYLIDNGCKVDQVKMINFLFKDF